MNNNKTVGCDGCGEEWDHDTYGYEHAAMSLHLSCGVKCTSCDEDLYFVVDALILERKGAQMNKPTRQEINNIAHWCGAIQTELAKGSLGGFCSSVYIERRMTSINNTLARMNFNDGQRFERIEDI